MRDEYITIFHGLVTDATEKYGYCIPEEAQAYLTMLLSYYTERSDFLPTPTFAEAYLELNPNNTQKAKQLGDTCLFVCGVFPNYGAKRGLGVRYYSEIGKGSYSMAGQSANFDLFNTLSAQFEVFADLLNVVTYNSDRPNWY